MNQQPHNFYNAQTSAQPPYAPPPPPQKPLPHERLLNAWRSYRRMRTWAQLGIGCLTVFVLCGMCSCMAAIAAPGSSQIASSPTATSVVLGNTARQVTPTNTATVKPAVSTPTPLPSPTATPQPQPTAKPTPAPTHPLAPTPTPHPVGVNGNPWGYDFNRGNFIYSPPSNFCSYFNCIASFWNGSGYVVECNDGTYSKSGGRTGSCSHHGSDLRPLYSH